MMDYRGRRIEKTYSLSFEYSLRLYFVYLFCILRVPCARLRENALARFRSDLEGLSDCLEDIDIIDHDDESISADF